jgi:hypothetical protein
MEYKNHEHHAVELTRDVFSPNACLYIEYDEQCRAQGLSLPALHLLTTYYNYLCSTVQRSLMVLLTLVVHDSEHHLWTVLCPCVHTGVIWA